LIRSGGRGASYKKEETRGERKQNRDMGGRQEVDVRRGTSMGQGQGEIEKEREKGIPIQMIMETTQDPEGRGIARRNDLKQRRKRTT